MELASIPPGIRLECGGTVKTSVPAQPDYRRRPPPPLSLPTLPMDEATIRAIVTAAVKSAQSGEEKAFKTPDQKEFSG